MKKTLYLSLILVAALLVYLRFGYGNQTFSPSSTVSPIPSPSPTSSPTLSAKLDNAYFSLDYDASATTSARTAPDSREWVVSYMGQKQRESGRTQTELWDGYMVSIMRFETNGESDGAMTQATLDRQSTIDACSEENVTPIIEGKVGVYEVITYYGGCLGSADHYYLMLGDILYRISALTTGDASDLSLYRDTVTTMLNSLRFK